MIVIQRLQLFLLPFQLRFAGFIVRVFLVDEVVIAVLGRLGLGGSRVILVPYGVLAGKGHHGLGLLRQLRHAQVILSLIRRQGCRARVPNTLQHGGLPGCFRLRRRPLRRPPGRIRRGLRAVLRRFFDLGQAGNGADDVPVGPVIGHCLEFFAGAVAVLTRPRALHSGGGEAVPGIIGRPSVHLSGISLGGIAAQLAEFPTGAVAVLSLPGSVQGRLHQLPGRGRRRTLPSCQRPRKTRRRVGTLRRKTGCRLGNCVQSRLHHGLRRCARVRRTESIGKGTAQVNIAEKIAKKPGSKKAISSEQLHDIHLIQRALQLRREFLAHARRQLLKRFMGRNQVFIQALQLPSPILGQNIVPSGRGKSISQVHLHAVRPYLRPFLSTALQAQVIRIIRCVFTCLGEDLRQHLACLLYFWRIGFKPSVSKGSHVSGHSVRRALVHPFRQLRVDLRVGVRKPLLIVAVIWILRSCFRCPPLAFIRQSLPLGIGFCQLLIVALLQRFHGFQAQLRSVRFGVDAHQSGGGVCADLRLHQVQHPLFGSLNSLAFLGVDETVCHGLVNQLIQFRP